MVKTNIFRSKNNGIIYPIAKKQKDNIFKSFCRCCLNKKDYRYSDEETFIKCKNCGFHIEIPE